MKRSGLDENTLSKHLADGFLVMKEGKVNKNEK